MLAKLGLTGLSCLSLVAAMADPSLDFFPRALQGDGLCTPVIAGPAAFNLLANTKNFGAHAGSSPASTPFSTGLRAAAGRRRALTCPQDMKACGDEYCIPNSATCCNNGGEYTDLKSMLTGSEWKVLHCRVRPTGIVYIPQPQREPEPEHIPCPHGRH